MKLSKGQQTALIAALSANGFILVTHASTFVSLRDRGFGVQTEKGLVLSEEGRKTAPALIAQRKAA